MIRESFTNHSHFLSASLGISRFVDNNRTDEVVSRPWYTQADRNGIYAYAADITVLYRGSVAKLPLCYPNYTKELLLLI